MIGSGVPADNVVDQIWAASLECILKGAGPDTPRGELGDEIAVAMAQAGVAGLLSSTPGFARMLYNAGYQASVRNTYISLRRLGMPTDFFWKFELWEESRAFDTVNKLVSKVFTAMLSKERQGLLDLVSVDPVHLRFVLRFDGCAECDGLHADTPMCFFHAGVFAGMIGAMLGGEFDAWETRCNASAGDACVFEIGPSSDREVAVGQDRWLESFSLRFDASDRFRQAEGRNTARDAGNFVGVRYYQMLIATSVLSNLDTIESAAIDSGRRVGAELAGAVKERFGADPSKAIAAFYRESRYAKLDAVRDEDGYVVSLDEAPEHVSPFPRGTSTPFLIGELEGLLSTMEGRDVRYTADEPDYLAFRFVP